MSGNQKLNATITIGGAVAASLTRAVGTANRQLGSIGQGFAGQQARLGAAIARNDMAINNARMGLVDAAGAFFALRAAIGAPIRAAAEFETVLEDIGQKAGVPVERLGALGDQIKQIARDTNQGAMDIGASVDALVGRGASMDVALVAADPIGRAATAYRAATDDLAAASWAAVDNLKVPADQIEGALDAMAQAGKEGAFELRDMAQYFPAIGAAYQALGQTGVGSVADLAAALQVVRKGTGDSSSAATNLQNVLQKIYSNRTVDGFEKLGINIRDAMARAAEQGMTPIEAIAEITNDALGGDLSKIGLLFEDAQVQAGMRAIIQNMDEYRRIRAEAMGANGVVSADYARRIKTAEGASKRWAASLNTLSITLGAALLPAMNQTLDTIIPIVGAVGDWAAANPDLVSDIVLATGALVAFRGALAAIQFVGLLGKGGALSLLAAGMSTVGAAASRMSGAARSAVALQATLGAMDGKTLGTVQKIGIALGAMVRAVPGVGLLAKGAAAVGAAVATISAPVWGAVAAAALVIGAAGVTIWKYWDRISSVFAGVSRAVGEILAPALDALRPVLDWFAPIGDVIAAGWDKAGAAIGKVMEWFGSAFSREVLTAEDKASLEQSGYDAVMGVWNGMKQAFVDFHVWLVNKIDEVVVAPFRAASAKVGAFFSGLALGGAPAPADVPRRAVGGYFGRGPVIVGERGPELRFENRAGFIATNRQLRGLSEAAASALSGGGGSSGQVIAPQISLGGITVNAAPGMDVMALAREVERAINQRLRGALYDGAM